MLDNVFSSFISDLAPMPHAKNAAHTKHLALILKDGSTLSVQDIRQICDANRLSPLFFAFSRGNELDISRRYARYFDSTLIVPPSVHVLNFIMTRVAFSVCEELYGALFSLINRTPAYINSSCRDCRALMGELSLRNITDGIRIPYAKGRIDKIKKVRAQVSDFEFIISGLREELRATMREIIPPL